MIMLPVIVSKWMHIKLAISFEKLSQGIEVSVVIK